jgi:very-short-patch-repair endonuclease
VQPDRGNSARSGRATRLVGLSIRRRVEFETSIARGFPVTSRIQTVADLGIRAGLIESVVALDMALRRKLVALPELMQWVDVHPGVCGITRLRRAVALAEPATESPMETRLRLILVLAGLPGPKVQVSRRDESGMFLGRPDLYYPDRRLVIEYDGAMHRESLAADNRRQNRLVDAGYRILRFTATDVLDTPASVIAIVSRALNGPN